MHTPFLRQISSTRESAHTAHSCARDARALGHKSVSVMAQRKRAHARGREVTLGSHSSSRSRSFIAHSSQRAGSLSAVEERPSLRSALARARRRDSGFGVRRERRLVPALHSRATPYAPVGYVPDRPRRTRRSHSFAPWMPALSGSVSSSQSAASESSDGRRSVRRVKSSNARQILSSPARLPWCTIPRIMHDECHPQRAARNALIGEIPL